MPQIVTMEMLEMQELEALLDSPDEAAEKALNELRSEADNAPQRTFYCIDIMSDNELMLTLIEDRIRDYEGKWARADNSLRAAVRAHLQHPRSSPYYGVCEYRKDKIEYGVSAHVLRFAKAKMLCSVAYDADEERLGRIALEGSVVEKASDLFSRLGLPSHEEAEKRKQAAKQETLDFVREGYETCRMRQEVCEDYARDVHANLKNSNGLLEDVRWRIQSKLNRGIIPQNSMKVIDLEDEIFKLRCSIKIYEKYAKSWKERARLYHQAMQQLRPAA